MKPILTYESLADLSEYSVDIIDGILGFKDIYIDFKQPSNARVSFFKLLLANFKDTVVEGVTFDNCYIDSDDEITLPFKTVRFVNHTDVSAKVNCFKAIHLEVNNSYIRKLQVGDPTYSSGNGRIKLMGSSIDSFQLHRPSDGPVPLASVEIRDCIFGDIFGLEHFLRDDSKTTIYFDKRSKVTNNPQRVYRLLRRVSDKYNDVTQSHHLHALILKSESRDLDFVNQTLLFFQELTNNHGRDFLLPVAWIVIVNYIFLFIFYSTYSLPYPGLLEALSYTLSFNPLIPWEFNHSELQSNVIMNYDSLRRAFVAILIYQTVVAARRFSFKK